MPTIQQQATHSGTGRGGRQRKRVGTALSEINVVPLVDVMLVMLPLSLGTLLTTATARLLDIPLDFTNFVVLPLLFGIGVDSAIHLVHRHKEVAGAGRELLETSTARAVFYSAFTTIVSFGSLAFAGQRGLASLGLMLSFGLFYTVASVLIVLPALLDLRKTPSNSEA